MHRLIEENLEEHLDGTLAGATQEQFMKHLAECGDCQEEVLLMEEQTRLLQSLRITEEVEPMPGFYARVVERIDRQRPASFWDLLVNPLFNRQLAAASLALLLLLGVYVVQNGVLDSPNIPARIIAVENKDAHMLGTNPKRDRNVVLVNLVTYTD